MSKHARTETDDSTAQSLSMGGRFSAHHMHILITLLVTTLCGVLVFVESPLAFYSAAIDGLPALGIAIAASAAGLWLVWASGNSDLPVRWQIGLGAGFGLGILSLAMLLLGLQGQLGQRLWIAILALLAVAGILAIHRLSRITSRPSLIDSPDTATADSSHRWQWLWLLIIPAIVLSVLAATVPPGLLWSEEGNGYDVLEYHLGVPKEYFFLGRIKYLDHNMYSNFPMNAEMLHLLPMVLFASPYKAAITAQMMHLLLGGLAAYAAWLIGRDHSRRAGVLMGIAGAALGWSIYVGALAYVENGMLFYGLLAAGLCSRAIRDPSERTCMRALAVGAMVGLACGYKYTAIPMIAVPLLSLWAILNLANRPAKFSNALIPMMIAATLFAPWMSKNQRMTGDPIFPLGRSVFGSRVWTDAEYTKFQQGHSPLPAEQPLPARFDALWQRVITDARWGYVPWAAAGLALVLTVSRRTLYRKEILIWGAVLATQILVWLFTTHLFARFAAIFWMSLVPILSALLAKALSRGPTATGSAPKRITGAVCLLGLLIFLAVNYTWLYSQYRHHLYANNQQMPVFGNTEMLLAGNIPGMEHLAFINGDGTPDHPGLPYDAKILMVGDARIFYVNRPCDYCVVFSKDRFAQAIGRAGGSGERVVKWLQEQGYTHVWVNFAELNRLGSTYGLPAALSPDLFPQLEKAGLKRLHDVRMPIGGVERIYGILYEVPRHE